MKSIQPAGWLLFTSLIQSHSERTELGVEMTVNVMFGEEERRRGDFNVSDKADTKPLIFFK